VVADGESFWEGAATEDGVVAHLEKAYGCGFVRLEHSAIPGSVVVPI